jgi:hypothetical protein
VKRRTRCYHRSDRPAFVVNFDQGEKNESDTQMQAFSDQSHKEIRRAEVQGDSEVGKWTPRTCEFERVRASELRSIVDQRSSARWSTLRSAK